MDILKLKMILLVTAFICLSILFFNNIIQSITNSNQTIKSKGFKFTKKIKRQIMIQTVAYLLIVLTGISFIL